MRTSRRPCRAFGSRTVAQLRVPPCAASSASHHGGRVGGPNPSGPVACQGGKRRLQIGVQGGLVLFDGEQVIAAAGHNGGRHLPLREERIRRDQPPDQRDLFQQRLGGGEFVPFAGARHLAQHRPGGVSIRRDQMYSRQLLPVNPPQRLPVDRQSIGG